MNYQYFANTLLAAAYLEANEGRQDLSAGNLIDLYALDGRPGWIAAALDEFATRGWIERDPTLGDERQLTVFLKGSGFRAAEQVVQSGIKPRRRFVAPTILATTDGQVSAAVDLPTVAASDNKRQLSRNQTRLVNDRDRFQAFTIARTALRRLVQDPSIRARVGPVLSETTLRRVLSPDNEGAKFGRNIQERVIWLVDFLEIPASDRIVTLDHNNPKLASAISDAKQLVAQLRETNDVGNLSPEAVALAVEEVSEIAMSLERPAVRMPAFGDRVVSTLTWIAKEAAGALVGAAALGLLALLAAILGIAL